ncbi:hypothetical protein BDK51DRAFT_47705 [Blyttiomyces helicus]|uniref:Uncharacterized protein n=1 Tax=Blyttiomyces helicus TaxID=388810 RepID=A0A4P9WC85_9FUNG|nr:hypothetical protein BDK51DRAFT_47705 [Blyttiomyces helicus]|eukprot:RKO90259.1 hypothetical protein BDK51DRAFT_47705 [Blyttiomyces helicus]
MPTTIPSPDTCMPSPIPPDPQKPTPIPEPLVRTHPLAGPFHNPRTNELMPHKTKRTSDPYGAEEVILDLSGSASSMANQQLTSGTKDPLSTGARPSSKPSDSKSITLEENATCNTCGVEHIVLLLRGLETSLSSERHMSFTCGPCDVAACMDSASLADRPPQSQIRPTGKRKKGRGQPRSDMRCSACARNLGVGHMQVRADGTNEQRRREEWTEPMFDIEVVCSSCWEKYRICSTVGAPYQGSARSRIYIPLTVASILQCGGGNSFRTGKWRPRELFRPGKRNCSLSHERIGAVTYKYELRRCPSEISPEDLSAMCSAWVDVKLRNRAVAKEMEASIELRTYEAIIARSEISQKELADFIGAEPRAGVERLIVLQWEAGKVKAKRSKSARTPLPQPEMTTASFQGRRNLHGFMGAQVNHIKGVIFLGHAFVKKGGKAESSNLFRSVISAATETHRANYPTSPHLAHVCVALFPIDPNAPAQLQHSHSSNWGGCGFVPVDKYVVGRRIEKDLFDEPGIIPDSVRKRLENWVATVVELLEWCDSVNNGS